jgi:nitroimidazol reductase NimA-like FMN-containing flavoprotein (pyridoxamine 5'-phosphate oxidase superfamily)
MINERDGTPLVHSMWYHYKDEKFFAVSNREGTKIRSLKKNPEVWECLTESLEMMKNWSKRTWKG